MRTAAICAAEFPESDRPYANFGALIYRNAPRLCNCTHYLDALKEFFPPFVTWTEPEGGMFIWVTLPQHFDSMELLDEVIAQNVAFVPGASFYANAPRRHT